MKVVNIGNNIENFILVKMEIENALMDKGEIDHPMEMHEFVTWLGMQDTIYTRADVVVPYRYIKIDDNEYLFVSVNKNEESELITVLDKVDYDPLKNCKAIGMDYFITHPDFFENSSAFIIKGKYYILP